MRCAQGNSGIPKSAFEKDSQGGFGVIHRASDQRREPTPDAEKEAACEAALSASLKRDGPDGRVIWTPGNIFKSDDRHSPT